MAWWSTFETAATSVGTAIAGALGAWLAMRKRIGNDSYELGLMKALTAERDAYKSEWLEGMRARLATQEEIGRLKGLCEDLQLRANELLEQEMYHQQKMGSCDEKVRALSERIKTQQIENRDLFAEVARLDPAAAKRLTDKRYPPDVPPELLI